MPSSDPRSGRKPKLSSEDTEDFQKDVEPLENRVTRIRRDQCPQALFGIEKGRSLVQPYFPFTKAWPRLLRRPRWLSPSFRQPLVRSQVCRRLYRPFPSPLRREFFPRLG